MPRNCHSRDNLLRSPPPRSNTEAPSSSLNFSIPYSSPSVCLPTAVRIVEVGPRDGLQNESCIVDTSIKVDLIHSLVDAGLSCIEVTSFVSPKWVPQLSDAPLVMSAIRKKPSVSYSVLVPNLKGFSAAMAAGAEEIAVFASATDQFSLKNINCTVQQSLERFQPIVSTALSRGLKVRSYISCVVGCPYSGRVDQERVANIAVSLLEMGCYEVSLGDTIGVGNPKSITDLIRAVLNRGVPVSALAIHCHDTRGTALANVLAALSLGVSVVDSSIAGLGGCPFAPGAAGNLATEDLVFMLQGMGISVGSIDLEKLIQVGRSICAHLKRDTCSRVSLASPSSINLPQTAP